MNPIQFSKRFVELSFSLINIGCRLRAICDFIKYKKLIRRNAALKNVHRGETCYIVGNGPSVKNLDASLLKDKIIFTVNSMVTNELFDELQPKYHCVIDRNVYLKIKNVLIEKVKSTPDTGFFFHRIAKDDIVELDNAYITYNTIIPVNENIRKDITKNANIFINVVPYSIMVALYMGFSKIVLLGCDFSFFASRKDTHFYELGTGITREESLFDDLYGSAIAWSQYNYIYGFCKKNGIEIVNATPNSLLDVFPQVSLEKIL